MTRVFVVAIAVLLVTSTSEAKPYPVNACVAAKQKASGRYCAAVLGAWSAWDTKQDAAKRDGAIARAADKLDARWVGTEADSLAAGADCADTTLSAGAARHLVDSAVAALVGEVNEGLDLGRK